MPKVSRKKYQECLRLLKSACKNEKLPWTLRLRAAELILAIYGVPLWEGSYRTKRAVKELVEESRFDSEVKAQVEEKVRQDAEAQARAFLGRVKNTPTVEESV